MGRFESVQGDIWEGECKIQEQHALIRKLKGLGHSARYAERDLRRMEEAQGHLKHHRDVLRYSLRNTGLR